MIVYQTNIQNMACAAKISIREDLCEPVVSPDIQFTVAHLNLALQQHVNFFWLQCHKTQLFKPPGKHSLCRNLESTDWLVNYNIYL